MAKVKMKLHFWHGVLAGVYVEDDQYLDWEVIEDDPEWTPPNGWTRLLCTEEEIERAE